MKKVLFGILGLGLIVSLVAVMSCGGSSGGAPTAESTAAASVVAAVMMGNNGSIPGASVDDICYGTQQTITEYDFPCAFGTDTAVGDVKLGGTFSCTGTSYTYAVTETFEKSCTFDISTCSMGNTVLTGVVNVAGDFNAADTSSSFALTIKSDKLTMAWGTNHTKDCAIDLTFNWNADIVWTDETSVDNAFTGNICGADWTQTISDMKDATKLEALCTALNSGTTASL